MKDWVKIILPGGLIILFFAFAFGDNALSYEDIEISRRLIITQNGNGFSVTDKNRHAVGGNFTDIKATPYVVAATVTTRGKLKQALSTYIDNHINVMTTAIPPKLTLLAMDSALYTYQQNVTVNDNGYHISYSMLMQKNGDYVILEERLRPETPVFLAAHYISRNTGLGQVPPTVQFSERDMLIMEGADERGNNATIFPPQTLRVTLPDSTLILITTYNKAVAITAYYPKRTQRSIPRDLHECVVGIAKSDHVTDALSFNPQMYTIGVDTQIDKAYCPGGTSLKKLVEEEPDLNSVVGIIYGVIENLTSQPISMTATGRNNYVENCNNPPTRADTQWNTSFFPLANISYYWIDPDTWEMQFLQTKALKRNVNSHLSAAREAPDRVLNITVRVEVDSAIRHNEEVVIFPDMGYLLNEAFYNNSISVIPGTVARVSNGTVTIPTGTMP